MLLLCDNEKNFIEYLYKIIIEYPSKETMEVEVCNSVDTMLAKFVPGKYEAILMEIDFEQHDGIEVGKLIHKLDAKCKIIYVSKNKERCWEGYIVNAFRYIIKTYDMNKMQAQVFELLEKLQTKTIDKLTIMYQGVKKDIPINEIQYIKSDQREVIVCTKNITFQYYETLQSMEKQLSDRDFVQPFRGYLVNLRFVKSIDNEYVIMKNGKNIPISKARLQNIIEEFIDYTIEA